MYFTQILQTILDIHFTCFPCIFCELLECKRALLCILVHLQNSIHKTLMLCNFICSDTVLLQILYNDLNLSRYLSVTFYLFNLVCSRFFFSCTDGSGTFPDGRTTDGHFANTRWTHMRNKKSLPTRYR